MADITASAGPTYKGTAKQIAQHLGLTGGNKSADENTKGYVHATALLRLLVEFGHAQKVGSEPTERGKGKGAAIYEVPMVITINLGN